MASRPARTPRVIYKKYSCSIYRYTHRRIGRTGCQPADQCRAFVTKPKAASLRLCPVSLILPGLLELFDVVLVRGALCALLPVVGRPRLVVPAPVALADDPGQDVHFVVEFSGELCAYEVGRAGPFAPGDELHVVTIATVLGSQRGAFEGQHGADAVPGRGLVDLQLLLGPAGVLPAEVLALDVVEDVGRAVGHLRGVGAGAAGQVIDHLVHVFL